MASDTMASIKRVAQEMSDHVLNTKKKDVYSRVDDILSKLERQNNENNNRRSVLDLEILMENEPKNLRMKKNPKKKISNISFDNSKIPDTQNDRSQHKPDFFERQISQYNQHQIRLNHIRQENLELEKEKVYEKPKISKTSQKLAKEKLDRSKPLYLRSNDILKERDNKRDKLRRNIEEMKKSELKKQDRASSVKNKSKPYDPETFEKWRLDQINWIDKKKENIIKMKKMMQNVNGNESPSNRPEINKRSEVLANKKYEGSKIEDRVEYYLDTRHNNMKKIYDEITPNFQPTTNREVPNYLKNINTKIRNTTNGDIKLDYTKDLTVGDFNQTSIKFTDSKDINESYLNHLKNKVPVNIVKAKKIPNKEILYENPDISKVNFSKEKSGPSLYNLNVRDNSAWKKDKENCVVLENNNYADIIGSMVSTSYERDKKARLSLIY